MIKQLFANAAIIITALFTLSQYFVNKPLNHNSPVKLKLLAGVMAGLTGSILVFFGVQITENVVVDLRYITLIISSIYGGLLSSIIGVLTILLLLHNLMDERYKSQATHQNKHLYHSQY